MQYLKKHFLQIGILISILIATIYAYSALLSAGYLWDDLALFVHSSALRNTENVLHTISQPILPASSYFRPVVLLSFIVEFNLFDTQAKVSHSINLIIFLINCLLVFLLARKVTSPYRALIALGLYALHPALVESTAWVSGRFDLMVTLFALLSLISISYFRGKLAIILTCLMFLLSAFSKEMALTLPALISIWLWQLNYQKYKFKDYIFKIVCRKEVSLYLSLFLTGVIYLYLRYSLTPSFIHSNDSVKDQLDVLTHLAFIGETFEFYLKMSVWPFANLNPMHPIKIEEIVGTRLIIGLLFFVGIFALIVLCLIKQKKLLTLLMFIIALFPVLNFIPLTIGGNIGHERFLALPLVFLCIVASQIKFPSQNISENLRRLSKFASPILLMLWFVLCFFNVKATALLWSNHYSFWSWAIEKNPQMEFVQMNYISSAIRVGKFDEAANLIARVKKDFATNTKNKNIEAYVYKTILGLEGLVALNKKEFAKAIDIITKLEESLPVVPHIDLIPKGHTLENSRIRKEAFEYVYFYRSIYGVMAESNLELFNFDKAIYYSKVMRFYDADYAPSYLLEAMAYLGKDEIQLADQSLKTAMNIYTSSNRKDAELTYKAFILKLCNRKSSTHIVCKDITAAKENK